MNVELHIEQLVLHGFAPSDRYRIGAAIQQELARLLAQQGILLDLPKEKPLDSWMGEHLR